MEPNNLSTKIMEKKIMIIALELSLFLFLIAGFCAIKDGSRPSTYGILFGLFFSWLSLFVIWFFFIYNWKGKISVTIFAGIFIWVIRTFFLLIALLIVIFCFLKEEKSTSFTMQILLCTLFTYLIPMFTVFIFWVKEAILKYQKKEKKSQ